MPSKRPSEPQVCKTILDDLGQESAIVAAATTFGLAHIVGVCRLGLDVRVRSSKSVFNPVERIVQYEVGQAFLVICRRPPKDDEEWSPGRADLVWGEHIERTSGAVVVIAHSPEHAREQMRNRGLPV